MPTRPRSGLLRPIALVAIVVVAVFLAVSVIGGDDDAYEVTARFSNASQLVGGEEVVVAGTRVGKVTEIRLADNGEALVRFTVDDDHTPLRRGTIATVRSFSLSGLANRQVQLTPAPEASAGAEIPNGGRLSESETVSEVDIDALFNTLDDRTVRNFKRVLTGFERSYEGVGRSANRGLRYANPLLSSSRRVLGELSRDERGFERLLVDSSRLSRALAERSPEISELVHNLNLSMGALGDEREALSGAIRKLPGFMRRFNATAVNLRAALGDLDPLVRASRPVATRLRPFFSELRLASADLTPAVRDLDAIVRRRGARNDLTEATRLGVPLAEIAIGPVTRNGATRRGVLPESLDALRDSLPALAYLRAYTPELVGWFNDFGTSGIPDANGGLGRIAAGINTWSASAPGFPRIFDPPLTAEQVYAGLDTGNLQRCPGSQERDPGDGSTPFIDPRGQPDGQPLDCDRTQIPPGP